jgi:hypothetical protein
VKVFYNAAPGVSTPLSAAWVNQLLNDPTGILLEGELFHATAVCAVFIRDRTYLPSARLSLGDSEAKVDPPKPRVSAAPAAALAGLLCGVGAVVGLYLGRSRLARMGPSSSAKSGVVENRGLVGHGTSVQLDKD